MSSEPTASPAAETPERLAFYERISRKHLTPLWMSLANLVTPEPVSACQPAAWSFADIRAAMIEAGGLITAKEAERRVLILENPGLRGQSKITTDLYAGVQLVLPGEVAPAHRHAQSALRFVLEGDGAHTAVNGERTSDALRRLHHHAADGLARSRQRGDRADVLAGRARHPDRAVPRRVVRRASRRRRAADRAPGRRFGGALRLEPAAGRLQGRGRAPRRSSTIPTRARAKRWSGCARRRLGSLSRPQDALQQSRDRRLSDDDDRGVHPAAAQGFQTAPYRSTDATVFVAVEGRGRTRIGADFVVEWQPRDIFVVPSWKPVVHEAADEAVLFSFSDRPIQEALHLFREERRDA